MITGDRGVVSCLILTAKINRAIVGKTDPVGISEPVFFIEGIFLQDAVTAESGIHRHDLIGGGGLIGSCHRLCGRFRVDIADRERCCFRPVARLILTTEIDCAIGEECHTFRICVPSFAVEAVFFHHGITAECRAHRHFSIGDRCDIGRGNRCDRQSFIDIDDLISGNIRPVARFILTAEMNRAIIGESDPAGVTVPNFAVKTVFLHNGISTEGGTHRHSLIGGSGLICGSCRCIRSDRVDVGDFITGHIRIIPGFILAAEINCAVGGEFDTCGVTVPDFAVKTVFLQDGIIAEDRAHGDGLIGGCGLVCGGCRCIRRDFVDIGDFIECDLGPVTRLILTAEINRSIFFHEDAFRIIIEPGRIIRAVLHHHGIIAEGGTHGNLAIGGHCFVNRDDRQFRNDPVDIGNSQFAETFIACNICRAKIDRTVIRNGKSSGIIGPAAISDLVLTDNAVPGESHRDNDIFVGRIHGTQFPDGGSRSDRVNVGDLITGHIRPVAGIVLTMEIDCAVSCELDTCGVTVPDSAVKAVFFHNGITAEYRAHRHFLIGHGGDICGNSRCIRCDRINVGDLITGHFRPVARLILTAETDRAVSRKHDPFRVSHPDIITKRILFQHGIIAECRAHRYFLIGGSRLVCGGCRCIRRDRINVADLITGHFRPVACLIFSTEIDRAIGSEADPGSVTVPALAVQTVFFHNSITAECRAHCDFLIGGRCPVCGDDRCIRRDRVNVADLITGHFRPVSGTVLTAEIDRAIGSKADPGSITVPDFAVETVFFHNSITAECRAHRDFLIGRGSDICGSGRCIRRDCVNVGDCFTDDRGNIPGGISRSEIDDPVCRHRYSRSLIISQPAAAVETVLFQNGIRTVNGSQDHILIGRICGTCRHNRFHRSSFINIGDNDLFGNSHIPRCIHRLEENLSIGRKLIIAIKCEPGSIGSGQTVIQSCIGRGRHTQSHILIRGFCGNAADIQQRGNRIDIHNTITV